MSLTLTPSTVKSAMKYVAENHRHLPKVQGGLFAVAVTDDGRVVGVGIVGNPWQEWQGTGRALITRVATDGTRNACSMIYRSLARARKSAGLSRGLDIYAAEGIGSVTPSCWIY